MKRLVLKQIEIGLEDGAVRLVIFCERDGELDETPHLVGIMDYHDPATVLNAVKNHLGAKGYPWLESKIIAKALKHRDLILNDPDVQAVNTVAKVERDQMEAEQEVIRKIDEASIVQAAITEEKYFNDAVNAAVAKRLGK